MYISTKTGMRAAGTVGRDAEMRYVGDKKTAKLTFSIAVGKEADGSTKWLNCEAWGKMAEYAERLDIRKGDPVAVDGYLRSNEYNGKEYVNLNIEGVEVFKIRESVDVSDFAEESDDIDDEDLPF